MPSPSPSVRPPALLPLSAPHPNLSTLPPDVADVSGATASYCPEGQVCFRWGVPEAAASSGSGNVYFQIRAPATYSWIGLGTGTMMRGSNMFVMYASGNNNVTLSTRSGTGHSMPQHVPRDDVRLIEGSGVIDGHMVANVQCSGCKDLDLSGSSGWIAAWAQGNPLNSNSPTERISKHDGFDSFSVDLARATVRPDQNPFMGPQGALSGGNSAVSAGGNRGGSGKSLGTIHGILMAVIFLIGYPLGSTVMPLVGNWILHASWQMLVFLGMWAGFAIGYIISERAGYVSAWPACRASIESLTMSSSSVLCRHAHAAGPHCVRPARPAARLRMVTSYSLCQAPEPRRH